MNYLFKNIKNFVIIIFLFSILSCKYYNAKKNIDSLKNTEIQLPEKVIFIYDNKIYTYDTFNLINSKYKILTYISGGCHACYININRWKSLIDSLKLYGIPVLFYISVDDINYFKKILYPEIKFKYPFIVDTLNLFYMKNKLYNYDNFHFYTFMVDKNNKIILIGNPAMSVRVKNLYFKTIKKINKKLIN